MTYYVLVFLSFLQSVIGFTLMSSSIMRFKEPIKLRVSFGFFVMISGIILLSYILYSKGVDYVSNIAVLFILIIELSWYLICSKDRFFVSFFSFLTFVNIYISISYISDTLSMGFSGNTFVLARIIIRTIIYLALVPALLKFVRKHFRMLVDELSKEWNVAIMVPLIFLVIQIITLYYPNPYWYWTSDNWLRAIIASIYILFLIVYYLLYIQTSAIVEKYSLEKQQLLMAQQEKLWESELVRQKEEAAFTNQQRHDMHHHNSVIMGFLHSNDSEGLKNYVKSFDAALEVGYSNTYCANPIINSILNFYANRANDENIETLFHIHVPQELNIENIDLTGVLGNALENALEGCLRVSAGMDKKIVVTVKYFDQRLRIMIENTCVDKIEFEDDLPMTQKVGGGTGAKSILTVAEKYDGTAGFSVNNGMFITQVVLNEKSD